METLRESRSAGIEVGYQPSATALWGTRILLVDDDDAFHDDLLRVLARVGCTLSRANDTGSVNGNAMVHDAVVFDRSLTGRNTVAFVRRLMACDDVPPGVVVLTPVLDQAEFVECIRAGARDYLRKPDDPQALLRLLAWIVPTYRSWRARIARCKAGSAGEANPTSTPRIAALSEAARGPSFLDSVQIRRVTDELTRRYRLSTRQVEMLVPLYLRKTNDEIADIVGITRRMAKFHVRAVLTKLPVQTRYEVVDLVHKTYAELTASDPLADT